MKKKVWVLTILLFILCFFTMGKSAGDEINEGIPCVRVENKQITNKLPSVNAEAAIVMDVKSGRILYEKNARIKKPIASTTKIMTAVVALENGDLGASVIVSERAANVSGSTINLKKGEKLTLEELLYGLMLNSGNDAAIAIAEHIGGSVEDFIVLMNEKAQVLGAKNTHYQSPHGLDLSEHYSTAYDLAIITRYAIQNQVFKRIVATKSAKISGRSLFNTNEMLDLFPGADGVKTGFTGKAGRCLVTSATRDHWKIISVVLNSPTRSARAQSSKNILEYSFKNFTMVKLTGPQKEIKKLPVRKGLVRQVGIRPVEEVELPLKEEEIRELKTEVELPDTLCAPVKAGLEVGSIRYYLNEKEIAQVALKPSEDIIRKQLSDYFIEIVLKWCGLI